MKTKKTLQSLFMIALVAGVVANTAISCVIALQLREDRNALAKMANDLRKVQESLEVEIELRENIFPQLQKSAWLLRHYNPSLDYMTALSYALKIYECSDDTVTFDILNALIVVESSADHRAVSDRGALGLTQIMPNIWNYDYETLLNPYQNIEIGAEILKYYVKRHGLQGGLSAYNSGKKDRALAYAHKVRLIAQAHF
jgi:soluble lytic murein transglycosylase-like protein